MPHLTHLEQASIFKTKVGARPDAVPGQSADREYGNANVAVRVRQSPAENGGRYADMPGLNVTDDMSVRNIMRPRRGYGY